LGRRSITRQEVDANFEWERACQPGADKYYKSKGFSVERIKGKENKLYDVKIRKNGKVYAVEEKFLRKDNDFLYIELIQDTESDSIGWIEETRADYLYYKMPSMLVICKMNNLKKFIRQFGCYYPDHFTTRGWGRTHNKKISISAIVENKIGKLINNEIV